MADHQNATTPGAGSQPAGLLRPVLTLGLTQIVGFGSIYYAFGVLVTHMSADLGITPTLAYGLLSAALLAGSLTVPLAGRLIDLRGARGMMAAGSVAAAVGFALLSQSAGAWTLAATLVLIELIAPLVLYDAAFAALAQAVGEARARRAITLMTLLGGFASTVFWPLTLFLQDAVGWRGAFLTFAALHLLVCLPLHLSLPKLAAKGTAAPSSAPAFPPLPPHLHGRAMALLALGLSLSWAMMSAFSAQWVPVMAAVGVSQATAVAAGALMGPAQVLARLAEMRFAAHRHPMITAVFAMGCLCTAALVLLVAPVGIVSASAFAVLFGIGQGLATMVRGTVPLVLFGLAGYAARLGKLASLRGLVAAVAPFAMAGSLAYWGASVTLGLAALLAAVSLAVLAAVPWRVKG
ncbi:MFS transporter [Pararhodobacter zhoushanensis]|uniref:MFS transporter n=1 Tax=Pararhodobacter zhoushanensis TaxID=2479545 RepID=A0ABT3GW17_9RHOB|nr:MFS transporter [Pararhodobacter zhoushanensis]MCW1931718.1 MFS transporter [Pararhodobacter zhoushanensis]